MGIKQTITPPTQASGAKKNWEGMKLFRRRTGPRTINRSNGPIDPEDESEEYRNQVLKDQEKLLADEKARRLAESEAKKAGKELPTPKVEEIIPVGTYLSYLKERDPFFRKKKEEN